MFADVYSHIIDEDRRLNAQRFEEAFYSGNKQEPIEEPKKPVESDAELLMQLMTRNPEMATLIKNLAQNL